MIGGLPLSKRDGTIVSELDGELVVYNPETNVACHLNKSAATVWRHSDGTRSIADLAEIVARELGAIADEDVVLVALDSLAEHDLIESGYERRDINESRITRRRFIRRVGLAGGAAVALPVVASLVVPTAAAASSIIYEPYEPYSIAYYHKHTHIYF